MSSTVRRGWTRGPFGYREAQLESGDFTAAMTLFLAGVPALLVGSELVARGAALGQLVLAVPLGALLGAFVVGLVGKQAAAHGAPSVYLARPAFGSVGASLLTMARLVLTVTWGAIVLAVAGAWVNAALGHLGWTPPSLIGPVVAALVGMVMIAAGPVTLVATVLRRRLLWVALALVVGAGWLLMDAGAMATEQTLVGGFFEAIDAVFALAILWLAVGGDLAALGQREDETANGLGLGFGLGALAFVLGGAALAARFGSLPDDLTVLAAGVLGTVIAFLWVPTMESDGFAGLSASGGFALESIIPAVPPLVLAVAAGGASLVGSILLPMTTLREISELAVAIFGPGVGVVIADAYVVRRGSYLTDDLYRWRGEYGLVNPAGVLSWLLGVGVVLALGPAGPRVVVDAIDIVTGGGLPGVPSVLAGVAAAAIVYLGLGWLVLRSRASTYRIRGV